MTFEYPDEVVYAHAAAAQKARDQLAQIRDLANTASWQENAKTPQKFHLFVVKLLKASGGFDPENI
jgi:hypothetical protein